MNKKMIMMSCLDIWSMGEGQGAPSFYNTIKAYVDEGWDITLIQPTSKNRLNSIIDGCKMIKFDNTFLEKLCSIKKVSFFARIISAYYCTRKFYEIASKIIIKNNEKYIIYAYEVDSVLAGKKLSRHFDLPLITRFQGTTLKNCKDTWLNRLKRFPHFKALESESTIVIMTDDGTEGDKVLKRLGNKTKDIYFWKNGQAECYPNYINSEMRCDLRSKLNIPNTAPVLLTVSRLASWKRIDRAINCMPEVLIHFPNCKLVIVGDGEEYDNLKKIVEQHGIEDSVVFTGAVNQKDIWKYYDIADVFLSLYDLSNVGNPLMEAMRLGKAIITLDVGETCAVIQNEVNGILLHHEQFESIAPAIIRLLSDEKLKISLGHNAQEYAKRNFWSWNDRMNAELDVVNALREKWD
ncbi:MAG: glycosyltransferase family 4 protein [Lutisporaceae bacterium]